MGKQWVINALSIDKPQARMLVVYLKNTVNHCYTMVCVRSFLEKCNPVPAGVGSRFYRLFSLIICCCLYQSNLFF